MADGQQPKRVFLTPRPLANSAIHVRIRMGASYGALHAARSAAV
jgi:hypothetical protein